MRRTIRRGTLSFKLWTELGKEEGVGNTPFISALRKEGGKREKKKKTSKRVQRSQKANLGGDRIAPRKGEKGLE